MHYKNGRAALENDPVVCIGSYGQITVGKIHSINAGSATCNCSVAEIVPGGVIQQTCRTVGEMVHAQDAWHAIGQAGPQAVPQLSTLQAENASLKRQLALIKESAVTPGGNVQNQVDWLALNMEEMARILKLPVDQTMKDLPAWAKEVAKRAGV